MRVSANLIGGRASAWIVVSCGAESEKLGLVGCRGGYRSQDVNHCFVVAFDLEIKFANGKKETEGSPSGKVMMSGQEIFYIKINIHVGSSGKKVDGGAPPATKWTPFRLRNTGGDPRTEYRLPRQWRMPISGPLLPVAVEPDAR